MDLAGGKIEYTVGTLPVMGCGITWTIEEFDSALASSVAELVFDDVGYTALSSLLEGLAETEFDQAAVRRLLLGPIAPENWRVGEAIAEAYLSHHRDCFFPWPVKWDERKAHSSLPGADLVGFQQDGVTQRFAFGEVKTSQDINYPPATMFGRTGLKQQIEDLRDKLPIRDDLVKYLGLRAKNTSWEGQYKNAAIEYIKNNSNVRVFGILVRDVSPHRDDLRTRVLKLREDCPAAMGIELIAVYIPPKSIMSLGEKAQTCRREHKT